MIPSWVQGAAVAVGVAVFGALVRHWLAKRRNREQELYIPLFNKLEDAVSGPVYDQKEGEFEMVWGRLEGHIKRSVQQEIKGPLIMFDGSIATLNRFLDNYKILVRNYAESEGFLTQNDGEYYFDMGGQTGKIELDSFIDQLGSVIATADSASNLWKRLQWNTQRGEFYDEINSWGPSDERVEFLYEMKLRTYREDPSMTQSPSEEFNQAMRYARMAHEEVQEKISMTI